MKKLPIGVSTFESIIKGNVLYVDKTQAIYELIDGEIPKRYFLSRPRCFGKSLTRSTLRAIFERYWEPFNILETKYRNDIGLWFNTITNNHHKLSLLIKNLYSKKADFKPNVQAYIEKFNTEVGTFRKESNAKAHNIFEYLDNKSELKKFKIPDLVQLLLNIYGHM